MTDPTSITPKTDLRIVLVRTLYDSNIGSVSRVMSNLGANHLILIAPECEVTYSAQQAAATGQTALQNRRTYQTWEEFYQNEPEGLRIALTARDGRGRQVETLEQIIAQQTTKLDQPIYLIFGPEHWGLSNSDLEHAHFACSLPIFGENTSYNLSHAVLLAGYLSRAHEAKSTKTKEYRGFSKVSTPFPEETVKLWLQTLGFDVDRSGMNVLTVLRRLLLHSVPTEKEIRSLEVVLHQSIRKMREYQWMRPQFKKIPRQETRQYTKD